MGENKKKQTPCRNLKDWHRTNEGGKRWRQ
nr:MAG TPA: hypothetical protein [Caudoviricetes sp.]